MQSSSAYKVKCYVCSFMVHEKYSWFMIKKIHAMWLHKKSEGPHWYLYLRLHLQALLAREHVAVCGRGRETFFWISRSTGGNLPCKILSLTDSQVSKVSLRSRYHYGVSVHSDFSWLRHQKLYLLLNHRDGSDKTHHGPWAALRYFVERLML